MKIIINLFFHTPELFAVLSGLTCDLVGFMTLNNYTHCQESTTHDEIVGFSYVGDHDAVVKVRFVACSSAALIEYSHLNILLHYS
jgi:hypothetical protein